MTLLGAVCIVAWAGLIGRASGSLDSATQCSGRAFRAAAGWSLFALFWLGILSIVRIFR